jgi:hypothetical protein
MRWLAHVLVLTLLTLIAPVALGQGYCGLRYKTGEVVLGDSWSDDPTTLAAAWAPLLERLSKAIPSLSPKEEKWLQEEMDVGGQRFVRAASSREYVIQQAKRNADSLLFLARGLSDQRDRAAQARDWLWFAYSLLEGDAALDLARLEAEGVIQREAIPSDWTILFRGGFTLQEAIEMQRRQLARHVLICTLPSVLGVSMVDR